MGDLDLACSNWKTNVSPIATVDSLQVKQPSKKNCRPFTAAPQRAMPPWICVRSMNLAFSNAPIVGFLLTDLKWLQLDSSVGPDGQTLRSLWDRWHDPRAFFAFSGNA